MAWLAVFESGSGRLISVTTDDAVVTPLPANLQTSVLAQKPDFQSVMWDASSRTFVARPAKVTVDRWNDMLTNVAYADFQSMYNALNASRKSQVQAALIRLLGSSRFRASNETIEL